MSGMQTRLQRRCEKAHWLSARLLQDWASHQGCEAPELNEVHDKITRIRSSFDDVVTIRDIDAILDLIKEIYQVKHCNGYDTVCLLTRSLN